MSTTGDLLSNAERLISDAEYLHAEGRARSAATLIVVALEQLGAFVEVLTREKYPEATVHMGIFGSNANAHAKRQDALAAHVMNFAFGNFMVKVFAEKFLQGSLDGEDFGSWLIRTGPCELSQKEQLEQRQCPDIAAAHILMHLVRTKRLKDLREFGLYENTDTKFADEEIRKTIGLASRIREILSRSWVTPEVMQLVGVNMPEGIQPVGQISKA